MRESETNYANTTTSVKSDAECAASENDPRLGRLRERLKMAIGERSARAVADEAGVSEGTVRNLLNGGIPKLDSLLRIADATGVDAGWLATGQGPRERAPDQAHGTTGSAPAHRPARPARREAAPRTGLYEPDEDPAYHRWPVDVGVFHALVNAADSVGADMDRGDRTEISRWLYLAIDIMTRAPDNRRRLDDADMQALARVVRKLIFTEENGG